VSREAVIDGGVSRKTVIREAVSREASGRMTRYGSGRERVL
jgi:hypothetical protein